MASVTVGQESLHRGEAHQMMSRNFPERRAGGQAEQSRAQSVAGQHGVLGNSTPHGHLVGECFPGQGMKKGEAEV